MRDVLIVCSWLLWLACVVGLLVVSLALLFHALFTGVSDTLFLQGAAWAALVLIMRFVPRPDPNESDSARW